MYFLWFALLALIVLAGVAILAMRPARSRQNIERARARFEEQRDTSQRQFLAAAAATGKPRGLAWKSCDFQDAMLLARDRATGALVALVGVTISFEAIEGGGMEDVEAVGNLRAATAVFRWNGRNWTTQGRAVFNLEPQEALERFGASLDSVVESA
ncbi:MAG TPA: hypothetical protein VGM76_17410 [Lacipirellulaceae bacterium]|jgi:hypothetical protein